MKLLVLRSVAMLVVGLAWACTASGKPTQIGTQPSWRSAPADAEPEKARPEPPPEPRPVVFAPDSPASRAYNDPPLSPPPASPLGDAIAGAIAEYCRQAGIAAPRPDGRLYRAASEIAAVMPESTPLAYPIIEFALQRQGVIEPSPHILPVAGTLDDPQSMLTEIGASLPSILAGSRITRFGIGAVRGDAPGRDVLIIILQASHVTTKPIAREIADGRSVIIQGEALGDYREPEVFVTLEDGTVVKQPLKRRGARGFRAEMSCRGRRGRQQVEITADSAAGSTVLANFPVWCGDKAPTSVTVEPSIDDTTPVGSVAEAEARMLELVNGDRKRHGLPPLAASLELGAVARAHSEDMRDNGFVAHVSPTTGAADDRVRRANIRTGMVLENVARAYGVVEAQAGLMNSPGHRANLLSSKATHIGIGIAFQHESQAEDRVMFITQVFMRAPPEMTAAQAREALFRLIPSRRSSIAADDTLSAVAQAYADTVIAPGLPAKQATDWRNRNIGALSSRFARVGTAVVTVLDIETIDLDQALRDPWVTHYGVGVARGRHAELGDGALFIVLLLAQAR